MPVVRRSLVVVAAVMTAVPLLVAVLNSQIGRQLPALLLVVGWLLLTGISAHLLLNWSTAVELYHDRLVIRRAGRHWSAAYHAIVAIQQRDGQLTIRTRNRVIRLRHHGNVLVRLVAALDARVPALRAAREQRAVDQPLGVARQAAERRERPKSPAPDAPSQAPVDQLPDLLAEIRRTGLDEANFAAYRQRLNRMGVAVGPELLEMARLKENAPLLELLVTALADGGHPPAMPHFIHWLQHENTAIRLVAARALDRFAGGRFGVERLIAGDRPRHDRLAALIPDIKAWWMAEGWQRVALSSPAADQSVDPAQLRRLNFIGLNPHWVMLGDGRVFEPELAYQLPRDNGRHLVGGVVRLPNAPEPVAAAIEIDSERGEVCGVFVRRHGRWQDVTAKAQAIITRYTLAGS